MYDSPCKSSFYSVSDGKTPSVSLKLPNTDTLKHSHPQCQGMSASSPWTSYPMTDSKKMLGRKTQI